LIRKHLPIAARWTLYALGVVESSKVSSPHDPVAAWFLDRHPDLLPAFAAPSILSMIRARATLIDDIISEEVSWARQAGETLDFCSFGAGFDARWYRLMRDMGDVIASHREVDEPELMAFKHAMLSDSSFSSAWEQIHQIPATKNAWTLGQRPTRRALIALEGVTTRLGRPHTLKLLQRLHDEAPQATIILDIPGYLNASANLTEAPMVLGSIRARWSSAMQSGAAQISTTQVRALGYEVLQDHWLSARPELRSPLGTPICAGMEALRILVLRGT